MGMSEFVHLEECDVLAVTDRAVLISYDGTEYWIPVSQMANGDEHGLEKGDSGVTVSITEWIAEQKGI